MQYGASVRLVVFLGIVTVSYVGDCHSSRCTAHVRLTKKSKNELKQIQEEGEVVE